MHATPAAFRAQPFNTSAIGGGDEPLPRHAAFRTRNLEQAREHMERVWGEHRAAYCRRNAGSIFATVKPSWVLSP
jgi:hypothetical protein